jgi:hypothetical protein
MKRQYTGNKDGAAKGLRPGMKVFIEEVIKLGNGAFWNNGDFGVRTMRGKESLSVHATGRAVDFSYRNMGKGKGVPNGRREAVRMCKLLVDNADLLGLEALFDYFPAPHGRAWMCDRDAWSNYKKETIHGAPKGDWLHAEVSPEMADSAEKMRKAFAQLVIPAPVLQEEKSKPV